MMRPFNRGEQAPKPSTLVDLPLDAQIDRQRPVGHHRYQSDRYSGRVELALEALSPVHVASGQLELTGNPRQPLVRSLLRVADRPVIPGSSFKGAIRSIAEAITASCVRVTRSRELPPYLVGCRDKTKLCPACRLLGAPDYQGALRFSDFRLIGDPKAQVSIATVPQFYRPRDRELLYYTEHNGKRVPKGRKFYMHGARQARGDSPIEVCRAGARFEGAIDFMNLTGAELGLLLVALGQSHDHPLFVKLGGAKPACYGSIKIGIQRIERAGTATEYISWTLPDSPTLDSDELVGRAGALLLGPQLQQLAETLRWPNDRDCPSGNY